MRATVFLFKESGKYYTEEEWRIPTEEEARSAGMDSRGDMVIPYVMRWSPDFRRIGNGPVLVVTQEPWGYPHLIV